MLERPPSPMLFRLCLSSESLLCERALQAPAEIGCLLFSDSPAIHSTQQVQQFVLLFLGGLVMQKTSPLLLPINVSPARRLASLEARSSSTTEGLGSLSLNADWLYRLLLWKSAPPPPPRPLPPAPAPLLSLDTALACMVLNSVMKSGEVIQGR